MRSQVWLFPVQVTQNVKDLNAGEVETFAFYPVIAQKDRMQDLEALCWECTGNMHMSFHATTSDRSLINIISLYVQILCQY